ncbi:MAG: hypothetical protein M4579_003957 [Chaenotheca gracillima]|nr:MAG: hypothetical protein M4579_003957 [Chaenotheca gracillima]
MKRAYVLYISGNPAGDELCHTIWHNHHKYLRYTTMFKIAQNGDEGEELAMLQDQLDSKIRIISPAIDMIELISARGNTSLESAVTLTKSLRWEIQSLGVRLSKAANAEELSRRGSSRAQSKSQSDLELKRIIGEIRRLLKRIEDSVPLINLAISTSGASLSTRLPPTVSPSRLLQASTFLTAGDTQFSMQPGTTAQIGPSFTLSMYMLFSGHAYRPQDEDGSLREMTWKEVIHKARLKLSRVPIEKVYSLPEQEQEAGEQARMEGGTPLGESNPSRTQPIGQGPSSRITAEAKSDEYAYQLLVIEDLDDDRVHSFEDGEQQPGPFEDVETAGIREIVPIHEISKIFYADTGKILNIGADNEPNSSVLLLKRDINAAPPRKMMERAYRENSWGEEDQLFEQPEEDSILDETQSSINDQITREERAASIPPQEEEPQTYLDPWRLPADLDPEWIAFEVYTEQPDSDDEEDESISEADTSSSRPITSTQRNPSEPSLSSAFSSLNITKPNTPIQATPKSHLDTPASKTSSSEHQLSQVPSFPLLSNRNDSSSQAGSPGPIRTSLSLLETLIRLTSLQQFQQTSHLSITDELLNFFLSESSTTGAGSDGEERRRKRWEARRKVGFDPYDESPVKPRGENGAAGRPQPGIQSPDSMVDHRQEIYSRYRGDSPGMSVGSLSPQTPVSEYRGPTSFQRSARNLSTQASSPSPPVPRNSVSQASSPLPPRASVTNRSPTPNLSNSLGAASKSRPNVLRSSQSGDAGRKSSPLSWGNVSNDKNSSLGTTPESQGGDSGKVS